MLNHRQIKIVKLLMNTNVPVPIEKLMNLSNKSRRTVMRDLSTLKQFLEDNNCGKVAVNRNGSGYSIIINDEEKLNQHLDDFTSEDEMILLELIMNDYITLDYLVDKLYISKLTVVERMQSFKENYQSKFNIEISGKGHHLGEDKHVICVILSNLVKENLEKYLKYAGIRMVEYRKMYVQIENSKIILDYFPNLSTKEIACIFVAACIFNREQKCNENIDFEHIYSNAGIHWTGCSIALLNDISDMILEINLNLSADGIRSILKRLEETYQIDLHDASWSNQLYLHTKKMLSYPEYFCNSEVYNIDSIKAKYPFSFDLSISYVKRIKEIYGYSLLNYDLLSLYFAAKLNENSSSKSRIVIYSKKNAVSYMNKQILNDSIRNVDVCISDDLEFIINLDPKLVLNGKDKSKRFQCTTKFVDYVLSDVEIKQIRAMMDDIRIAYNYKDVFVEDYSFEYNVQKGDNYKIIIKNICKRLVDKGAISRDEALSIVNREDEGNNLVVGNYWIPHAISKRDDFMLSVYIHLSSRVQIHGNVIDNVLVTLMSLNAKDNVNIFKFIYRYISENNIVLSEAKNYDDFVGRINGKEIN